MDQAIEFALLEVEQVQPSSPASNRPSTDEPPDLTHREREVAALVVQELTNRQIAKELLISERTVDHHVEKILKKLNLSSREQVASCLPE